MARMPDDPDPPAARPGEAPLPDLGGLLGMAMDLQQQVAAAQEQAAARLVEGQAGGGAVRIEVTGGFEFRSVTISPDALDPDDVEMLQDLVLAALHDAVDRVQELHAGADPLGAMGGLDLGGLDLGALDLGGLDLGGLAGALGVSEAGAAGAEPGGDGGGGEHDGPRDHGEDGDVTPPRA
jgi:DNA-binding YbaB/EbfC family protein